MTRPIDLRQVRVRLQAVVDTYPELRDPDARARLEAWLEKEQHIMTARKGKPKGDDKTRARVQRLRERRKQAGWQPYELWLPPDTTALLSELKQPGEALHETVGRALRAVQVQDAQRGQVVTSNVTSSFSGDTPHPGQYREIMLARLRAMQAEGLSLQAIANRLNSEGAPTVTGRGRWHKGTIGDLLAQR
jgi:hypothetical protein